MTTPLSITPGEAQEGMPVLVVTGEIDMSNTSQLADALIAASGRVVVDLREVSYLDSAGLAVLFTHADRIELIGNPRLTPVLTISGLAEVVAIRWPR